ncbi:MAG: HepT-like ribonuclease domain-containing protein [Candidatus Bathyarchaeia archaeon]
MVDHELMRKLKGVFDGYPQVLAAYLYGSYSTGRQTPLSDIDIAVVLGDGDISLDLSADIAEALGISEEKVSIIDLKLIDPAMRLKILREGVELLNRGSDFAPPMDEEIVEVYELEEAIRKSWLMGNPVDIRVMREIIAKMNEDLRDLDELLKFGYGKVMEDKHLRKSLERTMQTLMESMMDLLRHIVAGFNLGVAAYYRDYVDYAEKAGVVSGDTANEMRRIIPIRHALVHKYRAINYEEVWKTAERLRMAAEKLMNEALIYLKGKLGINIS